jgi:tetratricopeptide (TPR) repeat protein
MKSVFRILLYIALLVAAAACFDRFSVAYKKLPSVGPAELAADATPANDPADPAATNGAAGATNLVATNVVADLGASTNVATNAPSAPPAAKRTASDQRSGSFAWLGLFVLTLFALGGLAAFDFSRYLGDRAERSMMASDFVIRKDPDYEAAEEEWTKGNHLDAINLMRGYLQRNPNEQHAAIRIAEIYEKDLNNYLAAALELEEVLTKRLPREKWGWTAIHLANIYSGKLKQPAKALGVLDRIVKEYPDTGAAKKARQRLGLPEPVEGEEISETETEAPSAPTPPSDPPSNLPKGFRTKK